MCKQALRVSRKTLSLWMLQKPLDYLIICEIAITLRQQCPRLKAKGSRNCRGSRDMFLCSIKLAHLSSYFAITFHSACTSDCHLSIQREECLMTHLWRLQKRSVQNFGMCDAAVRTAIEPWRNLKCLTWVGILLLNVYLMYFFTSEICLSTKLDFSQGVHAKRMTYLSHTQQVNWAV